MDEKAAITKFVSALQGLVETEVLLANTTEEKTRKALTKFSQKKQREMVNILMGFGE